MPIQYDEPEETEKYRTFDQKLKLAARRGTMLPPPFTKHKKNVSAYKTLFLWWQKPSIVYAFSHPHVRSRLEKLMGSNMVSFTDRKYMQKLQNNILDDYALEMEKRIAARESEELERVKNLVLTGKIPIDQAPPEMDNHPVKAIEIYCQRLIAERRAKIKVPKVIIPQHLYWDDTPDPPSGLSIERGHVFRKEGQRLCHPPHTILCAGDVNDIDKGYMFNDEDYICYKYHNPLVQSLDDCETVAEMYLLADEILGLLVDINEDYTPEEEED